MLNVVVCDTCGAEYISFPWSNKDAPGCASSIEKFKFNTDLYVLAGGYGSTICDNTAYLVTPHPNFKLGICCDNCILEMLASNLLTPLPTYVNSK